MRIISGSLGGRTIATVECSAMRPTTDRVREAVFSALEAKLDLASYVAIDLYAGTGALGIEAISRGVAAGFFVEREPRLVKQLNKNFLELEIVTRAKVINSDVAVVATKLSSELETSYPKLKKLFLIDPPYTAHPQAQLFKYLSEPALLAEGDFVVLGSPKRMEERAVLGGIEQLGLSVASQKSKNYGDTRITFIEF